MSVRILIGDCRSQLRALPSGSARACVTSPPYFGLRDYGMDDQIGLEKTPDEFVAAMIEVFAEVWRVLTDDGTLWLNLGDSFASRGTRQGNGEKILGSRRNVPRPRYMPTPDGLKNKDLIGIPWRVAFALQAEGWYLRQDIVWSKPNPMPESVTDRCTRSHEYIFMFSKQPRYFYDASAIAESAIYSGLANQDASGFKDPRSFKGKHAEGYRTGDKQRGHGRRHAGFNDRWDAMARADQCGGRRNKRSVWTIATKPFPEAHFATFPPDLAEPCILAGSSVGDTVLDPFGGAGTTGLVADRLKRNAVLIELNPEYARIAERRISSDSPLFASVEKGSK